MYYISQVQYMEFTKNLFSLLVANETGDKNAHPLSRFARKQSSLLIYFLNVSNKYIFETRKKAMDSPFL